MSTHPSSPEEAPSPPSPESSTTPPLEASAKGEAAGDLGVASPARLPGPNNRAIWEMELLISGALVFSLLQLPGPLAGLMARQGSRLADGEWTVVRTLIMFAIIATSVLSAAFVVHLGMRAYWIGLHSLRGVFPAWIRWEKLKLGPSTEAFYRETAGDPDATLDRVDRICSAIYALALSVAGMFVTQGLVLGFLAFIARMLARSVAGLDFMLVLAVLASPIVPVMALAYVDKGIGAGRLPWLAKRPGYLRFVTRFMSWVFTAFGVRLTAPLGLVFRSNLRGSSHFALKMGLLLFSMAGVTAALAATSPRELLHSRRFFPTDGQALQIVPDHYRDQRAADDVYPRTPSIESESASGKYLKLFLPHLPRVDNALVSQVCPDLQPVETEGQGGEASREALARARDCLRRLWQIELDGVLFSSGEYFFFTESKSGVHGLMGYLPIDSLGEGRHELRIVRYGTKRDEAPPPDALSAYQGREDTIQFWVKR